MSTVLFYRQARRDGGYRTGIDVDGEPMLHRFEEGRDDSDPVLLWFVDLSLEGAALPVDAEAVRDWLLLQKPEIVKALSEFATELDAGVDVDIRPVSMEFSSLIRGVRLRITTAAARRTVARQLGLHVRQLGRRWASIIQALHVFERASR